MSFKLSDLGVIGNDEVMISDLRISREVGRISATVILAVGYKNYEDDGITPKVDAYGVDIFNTSYYLIKKIGMQELFTLVFEDPKTGDTLSFRELDDGIVSLVYGLVKSKLADGTWGLEDLQVRKAGSISIGEA